MITSSMNLLLVLGTVIFIGVIIAVMLRYTVTNSPMRFVTLVVVTVITTIVAVIFVFNILGMSYPAPSEEYCNHIVGDTFETYLNAEDHFCDYNYTERQWHYNKTRFVEAFIHVET